MIRAERSAIIRGRRSCVRASTRRGTTPRFFRSTSSEWSPRVLRVRFQSRHPRGNSVATVGPCDAIAENMRECELTRGATRRALKPSRGGVLVLRSTGTGRAEAERTLSILWDSAGPRVCGTRGERGTGRGPQASADRARKEGRASERACESRVGACNSPTLPIRARTPLLAGEPPSLSVSRSSRYIYIRF